MGTHGLPQGLGVLFARRDQQQGHTAHFVEGSQAPVDPFGWIVGVVRVVRGVVIRQGRLDHRALGQVEQLLVRVAVLPVEGPVVDVEDRATLAVGQGGDDLHLPADVVGVAAD